MNKKTTYILLAILVLLGAGYYIQKHSQDATLKKTLENKNLISFNTDDVNGIEIKTPKRTFNLTKQNTAWAMGRYPAVDFEITTLLNDSKNALIFSVVENDLLAKNDYGLGDDKAQQFTFKNNGKELGSLTVGATSSVQMVYVIKNGENKIYGIKDFNKYILESRWVSWLVDTAEKADITKITITQNTNKLELEKIDNAWKINKQRKASQQKIDDYLTSVSRIMAKEIPAEGETFDKFDTTLDITTAKEILTLKLGKKDEKGDWYYINNSKGLLFIIDKETRDKIIKAEKDFR